MIDMMPLYIVGIILYLGLGFILSTIDINCMRESYSKSKLIFNRWRMILFWPFVGLYNFIKGLIFAFKYIMKHLTGY